MRQAFTLARSRSERAKARREFRTLIATNNQLAKPHHWLGLMALEDQDYATAEAELSFTTLLDPEDAEAWYALGIAYGESGKVSQAKDAITSCLGADANHIQCQKALPIFVRREKLLPPRR